MLKKMNMALLASAVVLSSTAASVAVADEWNVSLWSKRRAFTENVEKLAELVSAKTNGEFTLNISYGGLSKSKENLDGISIGAVFYIHLRAHQNVLEFVSRLLLDTKHKHAFSFFAFAFVLCALCFVMHNRAASSTRAGMPN